MHGFATLPGPRNWALWGILVLQAFVAVSAILACTLAVASLAAALRVFLGAMELGAGLVPQVPADMDYMEVTGVFVGFWDTVLVVEGSGAEKDVPPDHASRMCGTFFHSKSGQRLTRIVL